MSNIFTGNEFRLFYNVDVENQIPDITTNVQINELASMPVLTIRSNVQTIETYDSDYSEKLLSEQDVSNIDIRVNYIPTDISHKFLDDAAKSQETFQLILQYVLEDNKLSYSTVNGTIVKTALAGDKDAVVTKTYSFVPTQMIARMALAEASTPVVVGMYGLGANGNNVPQYQTPTPDGNAFVKVPAAQAGNPASADMMGVGFVDGTTYSSIAMTKSGTLSLFAKNANTAWTRILTATQISDQYVPLTRTINGKALNANISITKGDVGLSNVSNDAQLKIASNLSDVNNIVTARTNIRAPTIGGGQIVQVNAPAGVEDGKYYPIILDLAYEDLYRTGAQIDLYTRTSSGGDPMNSASFSGIIHAAGWSDRGDGGYGFFNCYDQREKALHSILVSSKGAEDKVAVYVEARAFPVQIRLPAFCTATAPASAYNTSSAGVVYPWGVVDPVASSAANNTRPLFDFRKSLVGFYLANSSSVSSNSITPTSNYYIGSGDRVSLSSGLVTVDNLSLTTPKLLLNGNIEATNGFSATGRDTTNFTFVSKQLNASNAAISQSEFRTSPAGGQIVWRGLTSSDTTQFFNFNSDGTFAPPNGFVTSTGQDFNTQININNRARFIAGNTNGPDGNNVYAGIHTGFSGNYGFQLVGRQNKAFFRTIEGGVNGTWNQIPALNTINTWTARQDFGVINISDPGYPGIVLFNTNIPDTEVGSRINIETNPTNKAMSFIWRQRSSSTNQTTVTMVMPPQGTTKRIAYADETVTRATTDLGATGNINTLTASSTGEYYQTTNANATAANGYPVGAQAGSLKVLRTSGGVGEACIQEYINYSNHERWTRNYTTPGWSEWMPLGVSTTTGWGAKSPSQAPRSGNDTQLRTGAYWDISTNIGLPGGISGAGMGIIQLPGNSWNFRTQIAAGDSGNGRAFLRTTVNNEWQEWKEFTTSATSDETVKTKEGELDLEISLSNINSMKFWNFTFNSDSSYVDRETGETLPKEAPKRRGVMSQQIMDIDPQYVKKVGNLLHLDQTPMLLDGLAAIKALTLRDDNKSKHIEELTQQVQNQQSQIDELKSLVQQLLNDK